MILIFHDIEYLLGSGRSGTLNTVGTLLILLSISSHGSTIDTWVKINKLLIIKLFIYSINT